VTWAALPRVYPDLRMRSRRFSALRGVSDADVQPMCKGGRRQISSVTAALPVQKCIDTSAGWLVPVRQAVIGVCLYWAKARPR
jgi:hypothetical protein